jgi:betaine reductase
MRMPVKTRVIHYLNQFFAGLGGEEEAGAGVKWFDGPRGPGRLLEREAPELEVVATIAAGDNFMAENLDAGAAAIVALIEGHVGDLADGDTVLIAGPAFNAGRYGMACAAVCRAVQERLGIPAVTALYEENPAVESYRREVAIVRAGRDVMDMPSAMQRLARAGAKLVRGEPLVPAEDDILARGLRQNYFASKPGAERAVEMLIAKLAGRPFETEYPLPRFDRVPPAPAVPDLTKATVAVVTTGGIVPRGNPDRIESASASRFGAYSIAGVDSLTADSHQSVHGGYDPTFANADPNRVLPIDALRALEKAGRIGRLHDTYYATVGNATSVRRAVRFGEEIAAMLVNVGVHAVVVTST